MELKHINAGWIAEVLEIKPLTMYPDSVAGVSFKDVIGWWDINEFEGVKHGTNK